MCSEPLDDRIQPKSIVEQAKYNTRTAQSLRSFTKYAN